MSFSKIAVIGLGKVGALVAQLLQDSGFDVTGFDVHRNSTDFPFPVVQLDASNMDSLDKTLGNFEAVLSCLPYHLNIQLAQKAHAAGLHYFDLTEDVSTTKAIQNLSNSSKGVMVPQSGLAPGFIGIVGAHLVNRFDRVRSLKLRVGALPQYPTGLLGYAFNWSPDGVVNEY